MALNLLETSAAALRLSGEGLLSLETNY